MLNGEPVVTRHRNAIPLFFKRRSVPVWGHHAQRSHSALTDPTVPARPGWLAAASRVIATLPTGPLPFGLPFGFGRIPQYPCTRAAAVDRPDHQVPKTDVLCGTVQHCTLNASDGTTSVSGGSQFAAAALHSLASTYFPISSSLRFRIPVSPSRRNMSRHSKSFLIAKSVRTTSVVPSSLQGSRYDRTQSSPQAATNADRYGSAKPSTGTAAATGSSASQCSYRRALSHT